MHAQGWLPSPGPILTAPGATQVLPELTCICGTARRQGTIPPHEAPRVGQTAGSPRDRAAAHGVCDSWTRPGNSTHLGRRPNTCMVTPWGAPGTLQVCSSAETPTEALGISVPDEYLRPWILRPHIAPPVRKDRDIRQSRPSSGQMGIPPGPPGGSCHCAQQWPHASLPRHGDEGSAHPQVHTPYMP